MVRVKVRVRVGVRVRARVRVTHMVRVRVRSFFLPDLHLVDDMFRLDILQPFAWIILVVSEEAF